uniref:Rhodanese domain-containing protein n=1 Tax=Pygocentrus nattereri TaxID=42514 RepID=A0AAR2K164_PYGNA
PTQRGLSTLFRLRTMVSDLEVLILIPALVQCSTTRAEPALFLLDLREAEECDSPVVGTHPPVPFFKKRHHHPSLPIQWHLSRFSNGGTEHGPF